MATKTTQETQDGRPKVLAGERAVLVSYREYEQARAVGRGLDDYDILMRHPDGVGTETGELSEDERWRLVPASKYLKHRATGWREAKSADELPEAYRAGAAERKSFEGASRRSRGSA